MRTRAGWLLVLTAAASLGVSATQAPKRPDFSGEWTLVSQTDSTGKTPRELSVEFTTEFPWTVMKVTRGIGDQAAVASLRIGSAGGMAGGAGGPRTTFSAGWQDERLVIENASHTGLTHDSGPYSERSEIWSLDPGGKLLITITERQSDAPTKTETFTYQRKTSPIVSSEFVYETAPFPSAHASTIVETGDGLVAAWFGGTREGAPDVGIWLARRVNNAWTRPVEIADGRQADGTRYPCWNPVLFNVSHETLILFYKVGPSPREWWGMTRTSKDAGRTWSAARRLPDGVLGPIKNKPVRLSDGTILAGSSTESPDATNAWRVHFERSIDEGITWTTTAPVGVPPDAKIDAIQPSILILPGGRLEAIGRTRSGRIFETWSADRGVTWTPLALTTLPNPNAGIDGVTLEDGRHIIVYNHTARGRSPLNVAVSRDGTRWESVLVLESEPGEYSYPAVIQTSDGLVHVTYTWRRLRIKHVSIDPKKL